MKNLSARHELVCAIVQRYPDAAVALAEAVGVPLPEYGQVIGADLEKLRDAADLSLGARAMPAAMADLTAGVQGWAREVLEELSVGDLTLADLYFQTMLEEVPKMTMVGEALRPELLERLRELESFRDYEARVKAEATTEARAEAEASVEAMVEAQIEAKTRAKVAEAKAEAEAEVKAEALKDFLIFRGDVPSEYAINTITACQNPALLSAWLKRAYLGATSAQLFPEPEESKQPGT